MPSLPSSIPAQIPDTPPADHDGSLIGRDRRAGGRLKIVTHACGDDVAVFLGNMLGHGDRQHFGETKVGGALDRQRLARKPGFDRFFCRRPDLRLDFVGELTAVIVVEPGRAPRREGLLKPGCFARHLVQHHQQRGNIGVGDSVLEQGTVHLGGRHGGI